jgi:hypothetical protein
MAREFPSYITRWEKSRYNNHNKKERKEHNKKKKKKVYITPQLFKMDYFTPKL